MATLEEIASRLDGKTQAKDNLLSQKQTDIDTGTDSSAGLPNQNTVIGSYDADSPRWGKGSFHDKETARLSQDGYYVNAPELKNSDGTLNQAGIRARVQADNYALGVDAPNLPDNYNMSADDYKLYTDAINQSIAERSNAGQYNVTPSGGRGAYGRELVTAQSEELPYSQTDYLLAKDQGAIRRSDKTGFDALTRVAGKVDTEYSRDKDGRLGNDIDILQSSLVRQGAGIADAMIEGVAFALEKINIDTDTPRFNAAKDFFDEYRDKNAMDAEFGVDPRWLNSVNSKIDKAIEEENYLEALGIAGANADMFLADSAGEMATLAFKLPGLALAISQRVNDQIEKYKEEHNGQSPDGARVGQMILTNAAVLGGEQLLVFGPLKKIASKLSGSEKGSIAQATTGVATSSIGEGLQEIADVQQETYNVTDEFADADETIKAGVTGAGVGGATRIAGETAVPVGKKLKSYTPKEQRNRLIREQGERVSFAFTDGRHQSSEVSNGDRTTSEAESASYDTVRTITQGPVAKYIARGATLDIDGNQVSDYDALNNASESLKFEFQEGKDGVNSPAAQRSAYIGSVSKLYQGLNQEILKLNLGADAIQDRMNDVSEAFNSVLNNQSPDVRNEIIKKLANDSISSFQESGDKTSTPGSFKVKKDDIDSLKNQLTVLGSFLDPEESGSARDSIDASLRQIESLVNKYKDLAGDAEIELGKNVSDVSAEISDTGYVLDITVPNRKSIANHLRSINNDFSSSIVNKKKSGKSFFNTKNIDSLLNFANGRIKKFEVYDDVFEEFGSQGKDVLTKELNKKFTEHAKVKSKIKAGGLTNKEKNALFASIPTYRPELDYRGTVKNAKINEASKFIEALNEVKTLLEGEIQTNPDSTLEAKLNEVNEAISKQDSDIANINRQFSRHKELFPDVESSSSKTTKPKATEAPKTSTKKSRALSEAEIEGISDYAEAREDLVGLQEPEVAVDTAKEQTTQVVEDTEEAKDGEIREQADEEISTEQDRDIEQEEVSIETEDVAGTESTSSVDEITEEILSEDADVSEKPIGAMTEDELDAEIEQLLEKKLRLEKLTKADVKIGDRVLKSVSSERLNDAILKTRDRVDVTKAKALDKLRRIANGIARLNTQINDINNDERSFEGARLKPKSKEIIGKKFSKIQELRDAGVGTQSKTASIIAGINENIRKLTDYRNRKQLSEKRLDEVNSKLSALKHKKRIAGLSPESKKLYSEWQAKIKDFKRAERNSKQTDLVGNKLKPMVVRLEHERNIAQQRFLNQEAIDKFMIDYNSSQPNPLDSKIEKVDTDIAVAKNTLSSLESEVGSPRYKSIQDGIAKNETKLSDLINKRNESAGFGLENAPDFVKKYLEMSKEQQGSLKFKAPANYYINDIFSTGEDGFNFFLSAKGKSYIDKMKNEQINGGKKAEQLVNIFNVMNSIGKTANGKDSALSRVLLSSLNDNAFEDGQISNEVMTELKKKNDSFFVDNLEFKYGKMIFKGRNNSDVDGRVSGNALASIFGIEKGKVPTVKLPEIYRNIIKIEGIASIADMYKILDISPYTDNGSEFDAVWGLDQLPPSENGNKEFIRQNIYTNYVAKGKIPKSVTVRKLGNSIYNALPLSLTNNVDNELQFEIKAQLGLYGMQTLEDFGLVDLKNQDGSVETVDIGDRTQTLITMNTQEKFSYDETGKAYPNQPTSKTGLFRDDFITLGSTFQHMNIGQERKAPSFEKDIPIVSTVRNAEVDVSDISKEYIKDQQETPYKFNTLASDIYNLWSNNDTRGVAYIMAGIFAPDPGANLNKKISDSSKFNNERLEFDRLMSFYEEANGREFYLPWDFTVSGRYMVDSDVNPQASKITRFLVNSKGMQSRIIAKNGKLDQEQVKMFKLAMAQALDLDLDKTTDKVAISKVDAIVDIKEDGSYSFKKENTQLERVVNYLNGDIQLTQDVALAFKALNDNGEGFHAIQAAKALSDLSKWNKGDKKKPFEHSMVLESDAITSGMILTLLQIGSESALNMLEKGGIYTDEAVEFWTKIGNSLDIELPNGKVTHGFLLEVGKKVKKDGAQILTDAVDENGNPVFSAEEIKRAGFNDFYNSVASDVSEYINGQMELVNNDLETEPSFSYNIMKQYEAQKEQFVKNNSKVNDYIRQKAIDNFVKKNGYTPTDANFINREAEKLAKIFASSKFDKEFHKAYYKREKLPTEIGIGKEIRNYKENLYKKAIVTLVGQELKRNLAKNPVMVYIYGSSIDSIRNKILHTVLKEKMYDALNSTDKDGAFKIDIKSDLIDGSKKVGVSTPDTAAKFLLHEMVTNSGSTPQFKSYDFASMSVKDINFNEASSSNLFIDEQMINVLKNPMNDTFGDAFESAFGKFSDIDSYRNIIKSTEIVRFQVFKYKMKKALENLIAEKGINLRNGETYAPTQKDVSSIFKTLNKEGFGHTSSDINGALQSLYKTEKSVDRNRVFLNTEKGKEKNKASTDAERRDYVSNTGASGVISVHSIDGWIERYASLGASVLNIYDANITGTNNHNDVTTTYNKGVELASQKQNILQSQLLDVETMISNLGKDGITDMLENINTRDAEEVIKTVKLIKNSQEFAYEDGIKMADDSVRFINAMENGQQAVFGHAYATDIEAQHKGKLFGIKNRFPDAKAVFKTYVDIINTASEVLDLEYHTPKVDELNVSFTNHLKSDKRTQQRLIKEVALATRKLDKKSRAKADEIIKRLVNCG